MNYEAMRRAFAIQFGNDADAEDAIGDALLALYERGDSVRNPDSFLSAEARISGERARTTRRREDAAWQQRWAIENADAARPETLDFYSEAEREGWKRHYESVRNDPVRWERRKEKGREANRRWRARKKAERHLKLVS